MSTRETCNFGTDCRRTSSLVSKTNFLKHEEYPIFFLVPTYVVEEIGEFVPGRQEDAHDFVVNHVVAECVLTNSQYSVLNLCQNNILQNLKESVAVWSP